MQRFEGFGLGLAIPPLLLVAGVASRAELAAVRRAVARGLGRGRGPAAAPVLDPEA